MVVFMLLLLLLMMIASQNPCEEICVHIDPTMIEVGLYKGIRAIYGGKYIVFACSCAMGCPVVNILREDSRVLLVIKM